MKGLEIAQDRNTDTEPSRKATTLRTTALASSRRPRCGIAVKEERICPEEYSPVMMRAPRTATTTCPNVRPEVIMFLAVSW